MGEKTCQWILDLNTTKDDDGKLLYHGKSIGPPIEESMKKYCEFLRFMELKWIMNNIFMNQNKSLLYNIHTYKLLSGCLPFVGGFVILLFCGFVVVIVEFHETVAIT